MFFDPGKFTVALTLQKLTESTDAYGDVGETWTDVGEGQPVYAYISYAQPGIGDETVKASRQTVWRDCTIYTWYRTDITAQRRFKYGDRIFNITSVQVYEQNNAYLIIRCREAA